MLAILELRMELMKIILTTEIRIITEPIRAELIPMGTLTTSIRIAVIIPDLTRAAIITITIARTIVRCRPKQMDLSPLSTGEWLLTMIVGIIPCAGLILYIIWAFGNSGNLNRRNYCRASLILQVISYVLVIFFVIIAAIGRVSYYGY